MGLREEIREQPDVMQRLIDDQWPKCNASDATCVIGTSTTSS